MENNSNYERNPNGTPNKGGPGGNRPNGGNGPGGNGNRQNGGQGGNGNDGVPPKKQNLLFLLIASLITLVCMSYFMKSFDAATTKEIPYNEFVTMLEEGKVESVYITSDRVEINPVEQKQENNSQNPFMMIGQSPEITYYTGRAESDDALSARLLDAGVEINPEIPDNSGLLMSILLTYVLPILLL